MSFLQRCQSMQQHQKNNSYSRDSSLLGAWNNQQCNTKISLVHVSSFVFTELHFLKIEFQEALLTWKLREKNFQSIRVQFLQILYSTVHENNMNIDTCSVLQHVTTQAVWNQTDTSDTQGHLSDFPLYPLEQLLFVYAAEVPITCNRRRCLKLVEFPFKPFMNQVWQLWLLPLVAFLKKKEPVYDPHLHTHTHTIIDVIQER